MSEQQDADPLPPGGAEVLSTGRRRPKFRHDGPRWLTMPVFGTLIAIVLAGILFWS